MNIGIKSIRYVVPKNLVTNDANIAEHGFDEAFIRDKLGIQSRHIAGPDEYVSDLATAAGRLLLGDTGRAPTDIGLLVVVTQTPDYCIPHVSALVQHRLGLPTSTAAFDISLGCSGYVYGLAVVTSMMEVQGIDAGILITTDTYSKLVSPNDRTTAPLFGDAAAATLLTRDPSYTHGYFVFGTDGGRAEMLIARGSGIRRDKVEPLFMDGRGIFSFAMAEVPENVDACLNANGLVRDDIDAWVFHQASRHMLQTLAPRIGIPLEKLLIDMEDLGNTTSSTIPIVLQRRVLSAPARPNRVFLSGFGVGLSFASTVITAREEKAQ